jgi:hypothetical protein
MAPVDEASVARALRSSAATLIGLAAHELNNRLAVMRETLGLIEDLARAGKAGAAGAARAQGALQDQVGRAVNIVRTLSGLGSALGDVGGHFDAGACVADLLDLTERWAKQRSLQIGREIAGSLPPAGGDPALFICLTHRLLTQTGEALGTGGRIVVQVARDGAAIRVRLVPSGGPAGSGPPSGGDDHEIDRELARRLGGELLFEEGGVTTIRLAAIR